MSETCKACDKAWTDHLGVEPNQACAELIECCAAAVHRAYCDNYKKRTGNEYFTGGNYENLDDETKEIDRATVRAVIEKLQYHETCALLQEALDVVRVFSNIKFIETVRDAKNNGFTLKKLCNDLLCEKTGHCVVFENGYDYIHFDLNSLS